MKTDRFSRTILIFSTIIMVGIITFGVISFISNYRRNLLSERFSDSINIENDSVYHDVNNIKSWYPMTYNQQGRLFYLCKVWGFAKYFGKNENAENVNEILMISLDKLLNNNNLDKNDFCKILQEIISSRQNDSVKNLYPNINDYALISNDWMSDTVYLNDKVKNMLEKMFENYNGKNVFATNIGSTGVVKFDKKSDFQDITNVCVRLWGLFDYWNAINYFYPNKNFMDLSWDLSLYEAIPRFIEAENEQHYRMAIYRLTTRLCDSHASLPATVDTFLFGEYRPEFIMELIDNEFVVNKMRNPETKNCSFEIGDIILKIDGEEPREFFDSLQAFVCGGNYWSNQYFVCNAMLSRKESATDFTVLHGDDTLFLKSHNEKSKNLWKKRMKREKKDETKQLYYWLDDSTAYLDMTSLTHKNFNKNYSPIKEAQTLILDLRCYPEQMLAVDVADNFVPSNSIFANYIYADARYPGMLRLHRQSKRIGTRKCFEGKIIVLVDENTKSFSEYLTMMIQANPKAAVIGKPTSGAVGNVAFYDFPGEITTAYTAIGILYPDLTPTQRSGIKIDSLVETFFGQNKNF